MRALRRWARIWWLIVPEPRDISMAYTVIYAAALATGVVTLIVPPETVRGEVAATSLDSLAILLILGAVIGMLAGAWEHWRLERIGIGLMLSALAMYACLDVALHFAGEGSELTQLGIVVIAAMALVVRYLMIRRFTYRPRG